MRVIGLVNGGVPCALHLLGSQVHQEAELQQVGGGEHLAVVAQPEVHRDRVLQSSEPQLQEDSAGRQEVLARRVCKSFPLRGWNSPELNSVLAALCLI